MNDTKNVSIVDAFEKASDTIKKANDVCEALASDPKHVHVFEKTNQACRPGFRLECCACGSKRLRHPSQKF
jgi:hypothetical protein